MFELWTFITELSAALWIVVYERVLFVYHHVLIIFFCVLCTRQQQLQRKPMKKLCMHVWPTSSLKWVLVFFSLSKGGLKKLTSGFVVCV
jgi:hypothetical protein